MRVGAADTKGTDPRETGAVSFPVLHLIRHPERRTTQVNPVVQSLEMGDGRDCLFTQNLCRLDDTHHTGCGIKVSEISFHRPQGAAPLWPKSRLQTRDFDRVTKWRSGAVAFDVANLRRINAAVAMGCSNGVGLPCDRRRGVGHLVSAIVIEANTPDNRMDVVAVAFRILQPFEDNHPGPMPEDRSTGVRIEWTAQAVRGRHAGFHVKIAALLREGDRHTTGQSRICLSASQGVDRLTNRNQRRGTGGTDRHRRALEAQFKGHAGGKVAAVVARKD